MEEKIDENINKYDNRLNIGLCLEELNDEFICNNRVIPGEDLCNYHNDEQQSVDNDGYIIDKKIYKKYISNLLYYDNLYLINIEKNIIKEYIHDISYEYIIDIINIENNYITSLKPDINIISFLGKVNYLEEKINVYKFPISDNNIYKHIYDKYILYYKHICNSDLNTRKQEPYKVYMCCIENGKQIFETISFVKFYKILNLIYSKNSIISHVYDITYNQFNITKLIEN